MHTIQIQGAGITRYMPSDLSECTQEQYIDMCGLIFMYQTEQLTYDQFKVQAVYKLLKLHPSEDKTTPRTRKEEKERELADFQKWANVAALANLVEGFFEQNAEKQNVIKQYYIHNPVPSVKLWKTYCGPQDQFNKITFAEYTDALRLYFLFDATKDIEILYLIAAVFYRPRKSFLFIRKRLNNYNNDVRVEYNPNLIEKRAKQFKYFPIGFVYGVFLLFASFQKFISTNKIFWGGQELDLSILFSSDEEESIESDIPGIGMDSILFSIVEAGAFGTKKETMNTDNWEVLVYMYNLRKQSIDQKNKDKKDDKPAEN